MNNAESRVRPRGTLASYAGAALAIGLLGTGPARAGFIEIEYNSLTGNPGLEIVEQFPPSPVMLDRTRDQSHVATAETIVDSRGIVRTIFLTAPFENDFHQQVSAGPHTAIAFISDTAKFIGRGTVTWGYNVVGTGVLAESPLDNPLEVSYDIATASLSGFTGGQTTATGKFSNHPLEGYTLEFPNETFGIDLQVEKTFVVDGTLAVPDMRDFIFSLSATGIGGASLNLFDTAQVFAILPPGVSVVTDGGFSAVGGTPAVPEPSSMALLASAALFLAPMLRRRNSWNRGGRGEYPPVLWCAATPRERP